VSAPFTLGNHVIAPLVADFLQRHDQVRVDLQLTDSVVDLAGEGFDVAVRIGQVVNEGLVARPLRPYRMVIAAASAYLQRHGTPRRAADLARHQCLSHSVWQRRVEWTLRDGKEEFFWPENARFVCNQGDGLRQAAPRGLGLVMQPEVLLADDLASGALVEVLTDHVPQDTWLYAAYAQRRHNSAALAALLGFLEQETHALRPDEVPVLATTLRSPRATPRH